ncbi:MAG: D-alanyl-D-alanine carboxypeptidase [Planctomycetia bacterium]|nr:D-alanyl-D-alanine carboxypeptidase [Planctomycetia bacterium]
MIGRCLCAAVLCGCAFVPAVWGQAPAKPLPAKAPAERLDGPPLVSAKAWAIADGKTGKLLWGAEEAQPLTMASTTKIMTAWLVLQLAASEAKLLDEIATISDRASKTGGSTAGLRVREKYAVRDLLYGLLLPSGNDAAVALAEHCGGKFRGEGQADEDPQAAFVAEMNRRAQSLKMVETKYFDPHGNGKNHASARDLLTLTWNARQNARFREYVQTRRHQCEATDDQGGKRAVTWDNTNRLLGIEGYDGVKTGTTGAAGSCLVSSGHRGDDHLLIVVLGATSNDSRYLDTRNLFRWAWRERSAKADGGK